MLILIDLLGSVVGSAEVVVGGLASILEFLDLSLSLFLSGGINNLGLLDIIVGEVVLFVLSIVFSLGLGHESLSGEVAVGVLGVASISVRINSGDEVDAGIKVASIGAWAVILKLDGGSTGDEGNNGESSHVNNL